MQLFFIAAGIGSGFFYSLYSAGSKFLLKDHIKEPFLLFMYISVFQGVLSPFLWIFVKPELPTLAAWEHLSLAGLTCALAYVFIYLSMHCGDVSSVMPIMGSKVLFTGLLAIFILNEIHGSAIYGATVLVAISIAVLSYSPGKGGNKFALKPVILMLISCIVFAFTDILIKRSLAYTDSFNFLVFYNIMQGFYGLMVIPYLKYKKIPIRVSRKTLFFCFATSVMLLLGTLLIVITFKLGNGVLIPNILMASRGVFIVLISMIAGSKLDKQSGKVYIMRLAASILIILSIWIALQN